MKKLILDLTLLAIFVLTLSASVFPHTITRELKLSEGGSITIANLTGRVEIIARPDAKGASLTATSPEAFAETELKIDAGGSLKIETLPSSASKRIDVSLVVPERTRLKIETREGEIRVVGDFESVEAKTETGTIAADVPTEALKYDFFWTASRPRYLSDIELKKVKEKSGGKFLLKGKYRDGEEEEELGDAEEAEKGRKGDGEKGRQET